MKQPVHSIAIFGGTHGNETSGTTLIKAPYKQQLRDSAPELSIQFEQGNPSAMALNVRFTEEDLNRQFKLDLLAHPSTVYEAKRAKQINQAFGPKDSPQTDLVIDIHNTTANMGATLIVLDLDDFHVGLCRYVKQHMPEAVILVEDEKDRLEHGYLCTVGKRGVMVEVGPQPQGVCRADVLQQAYEQTRLILAYCEQWNAQGESICDNLPEAEGFRLGEEISYPLDTSGISDALVHPSLQDKDFQPLEKGAPTFLHHNGEVSCWQGDTTYPHFINEAAYQHLQVAFATAEKITI